MDIILTILREIVAASSQLSHIKCVESVIKSILITPEREFNEPCPSNGRWLPGRIIYEKDSASVGNETVFVYRDRKGFIPAYPQYHLLRDIGDKPNGGLSLP